MNLPTRTDTWGQGLHDENCEQFYLDHIDLVNLGIHILAGNSPDPLGKISDRFSQPNEHGVTHRVDLARVKQLGKRTIITIHLYHGNGRRRVVSEPDSLIGFGPYSHSHAHEIDTRDLVAEIVRRLERESFLEDAEYFELVNEGALPEWWVVQIQQWFRAYINRINARTGFDIKILVGSDTKANTEAVAHLGDAIDLHALNHDNWGNDLAWSVGLGKQHGIPVLVTEARPLRGMSPARYRDYLKLLVAGTGSISCFMGNTLKGHYEEEKLVYWPTAPRAHENRPAFTMYWREGERAWAQVFREVAGGGSVEPGPDPVEPPVNWSELTAQNFFQILKAAGMNKLLPKSPEVLSKDPEVQRQVREFVKTSRGVR